MTKVEDKGQKKRTIRKKTENGDIKGDLFKRALLGAE